MGLVCITDCQQFWQQVYTSNKYNSCQSANVYPEKPLRLLRKKNKKKHYNGNAMYSHRLSSVQLSHWTIKVAIVTFYDSRKNIFMTPPQKKRKKKSQQL